MYPRDYPKCVNGHLLTESNFYVSDKGKKRCRRCSSKSSQLWRSKNREHMRKYLNAWRKKRRKKK